MTKMEFDCESDKTTKNKKRFQIVDEMGNTLGSVYLPKDATKLKVTLEFE